MSTGAISLTPYYPSELKLAEGGDVPTSLQVLRVGSFTHPKFGKFEITKKTLAEMKANFDKKVRRIDPAIDYFHDNDKIAAGWPKGMELHDNGESLYFTDIEWTPRAKQMIADKELRYFSPEFMNTWTDPESGEKFSNVLFGGGLTNRPFVKDMEPITALAEFADDMQACVAGWIPELINKGHTQEEAIAIAYSKCGEKRLAEINTAKTKNKGAYQMDEKDKMIAELKQQIADLQAKLNGDATKMADMSKEHAKLCDENKALKEKIELAEKEAEFNVMLSEGKVCAAQKDAYIKGDLKAFAAAQQPVNLSEKGTKAGADAGDANESVADKVLKLAEAKVKADSNLDLGKAVSLVLNENKELAAKYGA